MLQNTKKNRMEIGQFVEDKGVYIGQTEMSTAGGRVKKTFNVYAATKDYRKQPLETGNLVPKFVYRKNMKFQGSAIEYSGDGCGYRDNEKNDNILAQIMLTNAYKGGYVLPTVKILSENLMANADKIPEEYALRKKTDGKPSLYLSCEFFIESGFYGTSTGFEDYARAVSVKNEQENIHYHGGPHGGHQYNGNKVHVRFVKLEPVGVH